jgi:hypothetical protein
MLRVRLKNILEKVRSKMSTNMTKQQLAYWIKNQRDWIDSCGGDLPTYLSKCGTEEDPYRGEKIYRADYNYLVAVIPVPVKH